MKESHYLNKNFYNIDFDNFLIIFFNMYKKHELIIGFIFWNNIFGPIFRHIQIFWRKLKKIKIAESLRSISPIKKNIKRMNGKNNFLSSQAYQML